MRKQAENLSAIGGVVILAGALLLSRHASGAPQRPTKLDIGPGDVTVTQPYDATLIVVHNGTTIHATDPRISIRADKIRWEGSVTFALDGAPAGDASACQAQCRGWCMAKDHKNWEKDWSGATPEDGQRGPRGNDGKNGTDLVIAANVNEFSDGAFVAIQSRGGKRGQGGTGCPGACFGLTPSGDDCRHGTKFEDHKNGNRGPQGFEGNDGKGGEVYISRIVGTAKFKIDAGQVHWN